MVARNRQINAPKSEADSKDCEQVESCVHAHFFASIAVMIKEIAMKRIVRTNPKIRPMKTQYIKHPMLSFSIASATRFARARFCSGVNLNICVFLFYRLSESYLNPAENVTEPVRNEHKRSYLRRVRLKVIEKNRPRRK